MLSAFGIREHSPAQIAAALLGVDSNLNSARAVVLHHSAAWAGWPCRRSHDQHRG
jgi:hypothetical protein